LISADVLLFDLTSGSRGVHSRAYQKTGLEAFPVDVGEINGRWGKYDDGAVYLNWRLVLVPAQIQHYIFAHAVHDEYDESFWSTAGTLVSDYEDRRERLRKNGKTLVVRLR